MFFAIDIKDILKIKDQKYISKETISVIIIIYATIEKKLR